VAAPAIKAGERSIPSSVTCSSGTSFFPGVAEGFSALPFSSQT